MFFRIPHRSDIIWHLTFSVWLTSLSKIISRSIHVAVNDIISFFFKAEQYSIVYMYHIFIHSSVDGHLGCFHILPKKNFLLCPPIIIFLKWGAYRLPLTLEIYNIVLDMAIAWKRLSCRKHPILENGPDTNTQNSETEKPKTMLWNFPASSLPPSQILFKW